MRYAILALLVMLVGCETGTEPDPISGTYSLAAAEGFSNFLGTPIIGVDGTLVLDQGDYSLTLTWQTRSDLPANTHTSAGTYSVSGDRVTFSDDGSTARIEGDLLVHRWRSAGPIDLEWKRSH